MGRGNNGRTLGPPQGARSFGQPPAGRGRESPRDDYPRLNVGGSTSGLSRSRSEEPPKRTAPPTRFDKDFVRFTPLVCCCFASSPGLNRCGVWIQPTLGPTGVGGSGGPMQGMGRGSQNRVPAQQQQQPQPKPKLVQKSLAPYNPRMAQSGLGRSSGTATGWNNNGAAVAAGTVAAVAVTPAVPLATEPAAAATTTARAAADAKTAESKATDFNAFLKKGPAPQGMRLPDELSNNAAKKDAGVVAGTAAGSNGQNVPYVRPADRDSAEPNRGADAPSAPLDPAMELIQRNKNQTAKATAQIPFKPDETSQGIRPPQQQPMQQQRGDVKRLPTRHAGAGTRNAASDRNRDRGAKKLGDRLALARGIEMPATRRTAKGSGNGMLAPGAETDAATSDDSSAQLQQSLPQDGHAEEDLHMDMHSQESQSAPPLQQPQPTQDGMSRFDSDASAVNAASAFQDQNADLDFERLMKEMVRHSTDCLYLPSEELIALPSHIR